MQGMGQAGAILHRRCREQRLRNGVAAEQARPHGRAGAPFEGRGIDRFERKDFDKIDDVEPPPSFPYRIFSHATDSKTGPQN